MTRLTITIQRYQYVLFIGPAVTFVLAFTAYPALYGVFLSFTNLHFAYPTWRLIGIENYAHLAAWDALPQVLINTVIFVGAVVLLQICLGLLIALLLNRAVFGRRLMRSVAILPWVI